MKVTYHIEGRTLFGPGWEIEPYVDRANAWKLRSPKGRVVASLIKRAPYGFRRTWVEWQPMFARERYRRYLGKFPMTVKESVGGLEE